MRDRMRLPLEFDRSRNGFYFTRPVPFLPKAPMTTGEMLGLLIAQRVVKNLDGTHLRHRSPPLWIRSPPR